jgi:hypothetical protein
MGQIQNFTDALPSLSNPTHFLRNATERIRRESREKWTRAGDGRSGYA